MRTRKSLVLFGAAALALALTSTAGPVFAQYQGDRGQDNRTDHGQNNNQSQGDHRQYQDGSRQYQSDRGNYHRFDDRDRQKFQSWYNGRRRNPPEGFRDGDRLPPDLDSKVGIGFRIGPELAPYYRPVPYDLARRMALPPPGYKYVMLGDRIVLLDNKNTVRDGFSFHLNF